MTTARREGAALVTGAGQRIGRAIALDLAAHGHAVALHCREHGLAGAEETAALIRGKGGEAAIVQADLAEAAVVQKIVPEAAAALGQPIEILINNASLFEPDEINTLTAASWQAHLSVNTLAPLLLTQTLAAGLPAACQGNVINLIDQRVWRLNPTFMSYTASKAALWTLTQTTAQALAPRVRVNAIGPGPVLPSIHQTKKTFDQEAAKVPLGHGPTLDEICASVRFLLETPSMTGQMLALDGGQHLAWQTPDIVES
ncbi:SDR family oxidoreductase [Gimibacter soli]|uniref:SDR family oxidoreductase n=1 Tax=Gimibacter soli TaxID=3024400 RepID=A0AAE9XUA8_9PROT|nr:SDR family oxidoreductase [Gimibacter soli]WCL55465.1 SDR family oxidoreductase [Gimibacter soli]